MAAFKGNSLWDRSLPVLFQFSSFCWNISWAWIVSQIWEGGSEENLKIGDFNLLWSLCCHWRGILSTSPHGNLEVNWQHNTEIIPFPQIFTYIQDDRAHEVDRFGGCNKWGPQVQSPDAPQNNNSKRCPPKPSETCADRNYVEKVRRKAEEKRKGRKSQNKRNSERRAQQKNIWVTLLLKLPVQFKNPTAFYLWAWKDERNGSRRL